MFTKHYHWTKLTQNQQQYVREVGEVIISRKLRCEKPLACNAISFFMYSFFFPCVYILCKVTNSSHWVLQCLLAKKPICWWATRVFFIDKHHISYRFWDNLEDCGLTWLLTIHNNPRFDCDIYYIVIVYDSWMERYTLFRWHFLVTTSTDGRTLRTQHVYSHERVSTFFNSIDIFKHMGSKDDHHPIISISLLLGWTTWKFPTCTEIVITYITYVTTSNHAHIFTAFPLYQ